MLNSAHRNRLRIVMSSIEDKMRAIESRLLAPEAHGLMSEIRNDIPLDRAQALREKITAVYELIKTIRDDFELPREIKSARREVLTGLSQLWVALQESNSKRLRGYGEIDPTDKPLLDPQLEKLAHLMLELEDIVMGKGHSTTHGVTEEQRSR